MTLLELRDKVDTKLAELWLIIVDKQAQYFTNHGRYWQGILTPSILPLDGIDTEVDMGKKPTDQNEDWNFLELPTNTKIPFQIQIDVYEGKGGHGYQATVYVKLGEKIYTRSKGVGNEAADRDYAWKELITYLS